MKLDGLTTIGKLAVGQAIAIDALGNARIIASGESPNVGEVIIESGPQQEPQASLVSSDGTPIDITEDVNQVIQAVQQGEDPTQLSEELDPEAGSEDSSSGTVLDTVSRVGDETIAATVFETQGFSSLGLSTTQSLTLLEQFRTLFLSSFDGNEPPGGSSNTPPESEDFRVVLDNDGQSAIVFDSNDEESDHISDLEDDSSGEPLGVVITKLPQSGTLLYDGEPVTEDMLTLFDDNDEVIGELKVLDSSLFSYQNDDQSTGFILGVKDAPEGRDGDESSTAFLNWGEPTDDPNVRVLNFRDDQDNIVDQITITTSGGVPTQYYADKNHIGYGLGVGGGNGIQQDETITIDLSQRPADSITLGLDGMGGWFEEGHPKETKVLIKVTLDDGTVLEEMVTKTTSGNTDLFREISFDVPEGSTGAKIVNVEVSTEGPGNWELRYLETNTPDDCFDYRAVDSDNNVSEVSTVTIAPSVNNPPVAIDDPMGFSVAYGTFNDDVWQYEGSEITAFYDGEMREISGDGLKRGVTGNENGGPANQIQFNREDGISEQFVFNLEKPATEFSFTFSNLFLNEGGEGNHEQGKWVAYLGDTVVASDLFIANQGNNQGSYTFSGDVAFDRVVFEAVDFVIEPARGSDSSDYFLTGFEASGSGAYAANQGEILQIPISELLGNDYDPDSDHIRFTHVSEANNAQIWVENGIVYIDLDDNFSGPTTFDYQITDDRGGYAEATVNLIVNPALADACVHDVSLCDDIVVEGQNLIYKVTLDIGALQPTEFALDLGAVGDGASLDDVDINNIQFTHGVTYDDNSGLITVPVGVSEFSVILPTVIDDLDDNLEQFTLSVGGVSSSGTIVDVYIDQEEDTIISYHDFEQIDVGKRWSYLDVENLNLANTEQGIGDGAEGVWGTSNRNDIVEVGKEKVYRGKRADDPNNKVFELEARRGDDQLYTEITNARHGQFFTLAFDVAKRNHCFSPMAVFLVAADGVSKELLYTYDQSKGWTSEIIHFQTPESGDYKVVFESTDADSYGALLDNIKLETLNNVGYEDGYFPLHNIMVSLGSDALSLDDFQVKLDVGNLPQGSQYKIGGDELFADSDGHIDVSAYQGDLSGLSVLVTEPGNYSFDVLVLSEDDLELKSSPVDITVLPEGSSIQQGTDDADHFDANLGDDILFGFGGGDTFTWQLVDFDGGLDVINDFTIGEDLIDVSDLLEPGETIDDLLGNLDAQVNDNDLTLTITKGGQSQSIQLTNIADQLGGSIDDQLCMIICDPNP